MVCPSFLFQPEGEKFRGRVTHQGGEFIDGQTHGVTRSVDGGTPLPPPRGRGRRLRGLAAVWPWRGPPKSPGGQRAFSPSPWPRAGPFSRASLGSGIGGIPPGKLLHRLLHTSQRPGRHRPSVGLLQLLPQGKETGIGFGKEDLVFRFCRCSISEKFMVSPGKKGPAQTGQPLSFFDSFWKNLGFTFAYTHPQRMPKVCTKKATIQATTHWMTQTPHRPFAAQLPAHRGNGPPRRGCTAGEGQKHNGG